MEKQEDLSLQKQPDLDKIIADSLIKSKNMFISNKQVKLNNKKQLDLQEITKLKLKVKINDEYKDLLPKDDQKLNVDKMIFNIEKQPKNEVKKQQIKSELSQIINEIPQEQENKLSLVPKSFLKQQNSQQLDVYGSKNIGTIMQSKMKKLVKPDWHPQWKLMRVISGHQGWVRALAVDPSNKWFVSGSNDRTIKFWDMASGDLKITLTGHINTIRGLTVSNKHTYLYSVSEDKTVKCWDLEYNKIIRNYHGHLSGVYCVAQHPTLDVIFTGGRDATVRVWDIRTRNQVHVLSGHQNVIGSLVSQEFEPQVISGSHDNTIRCWDLAMGRSVQTLTNHKKAIRSLVLHHEEYTFASGAADNVKVWKCPEGQFMRNISGHSAIINCMSLNRANVLVTGGDNGSLYFWDWKSGYNFQTIQSKVQPGSISAEGGIFSSTFDLSGIRLITGECDKTIKIWKEDEESTMETHPVDDIRLEFDHKF